MKYFIFSADPLAVSEIAESIKELDVEVLETHNVLGAILVETKLNPKKLQIEGVRAVEELPEEN